jgi:type II secretory pathway pseudopilin PulG
MSRRLLRRLWSEGEQGIALVLAIVIIAIISIAAASAIFYTDGSQRDAFSSKSNQTAYSLAQAALSDATAQLTSEFYDASGQPKDNTTSLTTMAQTWAPSGSDPASCSPNAQTSCLTWSGVLYCRDPVTSCPADPGLSPFPFSGVERAAWYLTATGSVPNPSGTRPIQRVIHAYLPVKQPPAIAPPPDILKAIYNGNTNPGCDLTMDQGTTWAAPVYVVGNLCINNSSGVEAGTQNLGTLTVGGWLALNQQGNGSHVGTSTTPLSFTSPPTRPNAMYIAGSCDGTQTMSPCSLSKPNGKSYYTDSSGSIFVSSYDTTPADVVAQFPPAPSVDWTQRQEDGNDFTCTGQSLDTTLDPPNYWFDLGGSPYSCTSNDPDNPYKLTWDGTTLTVNGNVYIKGPVVTSNGESIIYKGLGNIFVGGSVTFGNNTAICVGSAPSNHDCPNGAGYTLPKSWDSGGTFSFASNFLMILAQSQIHTNSVNGQFAFEGGLYSDQNINFGSGHTNIYGPMVTPQEIYPGQQAASGFPDILDLFTGGPGSPTPYWTLGEPTQGSY